MQTKTLLFGFTLCVSVLTAPLAGLQSGANVTKVELREEAATDGEMHTTGLGIWKRATMNEASASQARTEAPVVQKRTGFGIISGGSNEEA